VTTPGGGHGFAIRPAVEADLPALVALLADDPLGSGREAHAGDDLTPYRRAFELITGDPAHALVVAVDGDDVVARCSCRSCPACPAVAPCAGRSRRCGSGRTTGGMAWGRR
jgi:hypothetical protein